MKHIIVGLLMVTSLSSCAVNVGARRGYRNVAVAPDYYYGTVTYYDPVTRRVDLDYLEGDRHMTRSVYYDDRNTRWEGLRSEEIRTGVVVRVRGHQRRGRWMADSFGRDDRH